jgi:hypothetical protein
MEGHYGTTSPMVAYHHSPALFKRADLGWKTACPADITPLIPLTKVYRVLMRKPEGRRPLGRPRHRREDYIKMDVQKVGWGDLDWIALAQDRGRWWALVNAVMSLRVPLNAGNFLTG